jgi:NADPH:quinone reductase-like Zn-dependent oxidoreductase
MKAAVITRQGRPVAPNVRLVGDWPDLAVAPAGMAIVRTEASALNQLDLTVGKGVPGLDLTYPRVSGADGVGIVEAVGADVDPKWVGARVALNAQVPRRDPHRPALAPAADDREMIGEHLQGTHAERFIAPVASLLDIGECDPADAAAFALVHLTAWRMLVTRAQIRPGMSVLIPGIGGGVALALLNIARHLGCITLVTSRSAAKLDRAAALGADHAILDDGSDWSKQVRAATGKRGVDICADSVGKAVHLPCVKSLARGGVLVTCGATSGFDAVTDLGRIFWLQLSILGSTMGDMHEFRQVMSLLRRGLLRPVVDRVFAAHEAPDAFARLESAEQFGKVVIRWS